jgi:hypothetical protein
MVDVAPQKLIEQYDEITPAEAVDYVAVNIEGYTQEEWAEKRDLGGHQSVGQNVRNARKKINSQAKPREVIQEVVVAPDDVIEALRFNGRPQGQKNQRSAVLRVSPPFYIKSNAEIFYTESGTHYPPDMSPQPIHITPEVFVSDVRSSGVVKREARRNARDELDNPADEEINEWVDESMDVWEENVRSSLLDETDINNSKHEHGGPHVVPITYESE